MQTATTSPDICDDEGFYLFGVPQPLAGAAGPLPNLSSMSVATLGPKGEFISSRLLNRAELEEAWAAHHARSTR